MKLIIWRKLHEIVLSFIDKKIVDPEYEYDRWHKQGEYCFIAFANENSVLGCTNEERGNFFPPTNINIYRYDELIPDIHYLSEISIALHEFGHFISYHSGDVKNCISETGYNYTLDKNCQKAILFLEELNAWKLGLVSLYCIEIKLIYKILISIYMIFYMLFPLFKYKLYAEGIIN